MSAPVSEGPGTALPWRLVMTRKEHDPNYFWHEIVAEGRNPNVDHEASAIAEVFEVRSEGIFDPEGLPNAAYIVRAANAFPALLEALEELSAAVEYAGVFAGPKGQSLRAKAQSAIALAKGASAS